MAWFNGLFITHITREMFDLKAHQLLATAIMDIRHLPTTLEKWSEMDSQPSKQHPWVQSIMRQKGN